MEDQHPEDKQAAELERLRTQARGDLKLIKKAEMVLGELDRASVLRDDQADVLVALRIRIEGKARAKLDDLLTAAGDIGGKGDLGDLLSGVDKPKTADWPVVEEKKNWPGL
ncbi:MAG TPA: hypothetical protein VNC78_07270 [Actinomycetota bacterium]|nr:hypothetical protein [Actinomycetota bacterium]